VNPQDVIQLFPIRLDNIISFLGFAAGGLVGWWVMKRDILTISLKQDFLKQTVEKQSGEIAKLADAFSKATVYEERFLNIQQDINDLKHGRGFVDLRAALRALGERDERN